MGTHITLSLIYILVLSHLPACMTLLENLCNYNPSDLDTPFHCNIDSGSFIDSTQLPLDQDEYSSTPFKELVVVEYNIDRNGKGGDGINQIGILGIVQAIESFGKVDVLILSEVARDCTKYNNSINGAEFLARTFSMAYAYVVEFLETHIDELNP